jgi:DNA-binding NarL/FixJ family response regulator
MSSRPSYGTIRTIVIADRELPIRVGLLTILDGEPGVTVPAPVSTIEELTALASRHREALILMDTHFPDGDGIDACRKLLSQHHGLRIMFFANSATPPIFMQAVDAGATGFLLKSISQTDLLAGIRQMLTGQTVYDPALMGAALKWIGKQRSTDIPHPQLSPRHQQILPLLSEGLTNKEISTQLNLSEKTIKNYLADLFDRLQMSRRAQVAAWFISRTAQQSPSRDSSAMAEKNWEHTRARSHGTEEPLHAYNSPY